MCLVKRLLFHICDKFAGECFSTLGYKYLVFAKLATHSASGPVALRLPFVSECYEEANVFNPSVKYGAPEIQKAEY